MINKKYKILAVDMDGTLLNSKKEITDNTLEAIRCGRENGMIFTFSTGRPRASIERYLDDVMPDIPAIIYNGGQVFDFKNRKCIEKVDLDTQDARTIYELANQFDVTAAVWSNEKLYTNRLDENISEYKKLSGLQPILIENQDELFSKSIMKIIFIAEPSKIAKINENLLGKTIGTATWCVSVPVCLEFFNSKVSKGKALEKIAKMSGVTLDEVIAVGDGENDISMLNVAGLSIAMDNAMPTVKKVADKITDSCDEDGVASIIYKYFL